MHGIIGILVILLVAWAVSERRLQVRPLAVVITLVVQIVLAAILLRVPVVSEALASINVVVGAIGTATREGTSFVFGYIGGGELPFDLAADSAPHIFAFQLIPQVLVFAVLVALLWYWRVLPMVIKGFAWLLQRTLGIGGAVGCAAAASVFVGMVESPMVIRAHLKTITRSEFFVVITCGMSTVAGSIMVLYVSIIGSVVQDALGHIVTASILNVLGGILIARVMIPDDTVTDSGEIEDAFGYQSSFDAITRGTTDGVRIVVNIIAMLIVLISLVALINHIIAFIPAGDAPLSLGGIAGWVFQPLSWCMGIPWSDANAAGQLMGTKLVINELVAYQQLGVVGLDLQERTNLILTYSLCGFTNLGSVGILIGGVSAIVPERRDDLLALAPRTLLSGTLVAFLTGSIVGLVSSIG
ncbi:MAG: nucleoside:proton symporter [Gammaproteobacteria bacterium]|nr:nucleoside:proton symporter [Gammaproteobacteria bacterium]MYD79384.1 nucleoside:proton symporter [Gammaproteobacteria bacterium]